jgi:glycosyltransferase involved in cell wall biosynthesis
MSDRRLRIAFVIDDLGIGGAQRQLVLIASALADRVEPRVIVLSGIVEPHATTLVARGIPVVAIPRRSHADPFRLASLVGALRGADVVHAFLDASNVYAFIAARMVGRPGVLWLSSDRIMLQGWRRRVLTWMLRRADAVTVNSVAGEAFLTRHVGVSPTRVHRVPNIVPAAPLPPEPPASAPVVGCVGRLAREKRVDAVVSAFLAVRDRVPGARLLIVGDGPGRAALEAQVQQLGLADAVTFAGASNRPLDAMAGMACLVLASVFEGLPNAALEAMSIGVPVVAPRVGDLGSIVRDGVTGIAVDDASPEALAQAIVRAITDPALRETSRREGPRLMRERYSEAGILPGLISMYDRLAATENGHPHSS